MFMICSTITEISQVEISMNIEELISLLLIFYGLAEKSRASRSEGAERAAGMIAPGQIAMTDWETPESGGDTTLTATCLRTVPTGPNRRFLVSRDA
jgi:hypothetical protein